MNVWLFSNNADWEKSVINHFKSTGKWNNVVWNSKENPDKTYDEGLYLRGIQYPEYKHIPEDVYNKIYPDLYQFIDMYSRNSGIHIQQNEYLRFSIHQYLNFFNIVLHYYYFHFTENHIDLIIFNRAPHNGYDFLCYRMAEELNIKTLILEQTRIPNRFYFYWNNKDYGTFATSKKLFELEHIELEPKFEKVLPYMDKPELTFKQRLINLYQSPESLLIRETLNKSQREQAYFRYKRKKQFKRNNQKYFSAVPDYTQKYVYFGFHLQPELTTSNFGDIYCDQLLALERLAKIIPEDWKIYVKENPKQGYFMRDDLFYERLQQIPKLVCVKGETSTYDLLKNCQFGSTITGTLGWEAITGGKPALVFGFGTWYKTCPGVVEYHENITLDEIMNQSFTIKDIEKQYNEINSLTGIGVVYNKYWLNREMVDDYSKETNIKNIIHSFEEILGYK